MEEVLLLINYSAFWSGCLVFIEIIEQSRKLSLLVVFFFVLLFGPDHVTVNFARSGGPGGQNVNKGLVRLVSEDKIAF